jgi:hypothetical protein
MERPSIGWSILSGSLGWNRRDKVKAKGRGFFDTIKGGITTKVLTRVLVRFWVGFPQKSLQSFPKGLAGKESTRLDYPNLIAPDRARFGQGFLTRLKNFVCF